MDAAQIRHAWEIAKLRLTRAKDHEMRLRLIVADKLFPDAELGSNRRDGLTLTISENYSLDRDLDKIVLILEEIARECPRDDIEGLCNYSATLSKSVYDGLSDKAKLIFAEVLTIKPATPSLKSDKDKDG